MSKSTSKGISLTKGIFIDLKKIWVSETSCPLNPSVRYLTCKNPDGSKFNNGRIQNSSDFKKLADGVPNGVTCAKVECPDRVLAIGNG